ncbi:MIP/aquaporin family protein [Microbacteriaceae bacterium 4G12]
MLQYISELIGTAILVLFGNGVVANVHLKASKGYNTGWLVIATGWGFAVGIPAVLFGGISGNHINPAFTVGLAVAGEFPWEQVPYYITAQLIGAFIGAVLVWAMYWPFMNLTDNKTDVLGCFGSVPSVKKRVNSFTTEFIGTFVLVFGALGITRSPIMDKGLAHVVIGFLVWGLVLSVGGPTGPALNPARDIMPRLAHTLLPIKNKRDSDWSYSWVPLFAPMLGGIIGVVSYFSIYGH